MTISYFHDAKRRGEGVQDSKSQQDKAKSPPKELKLSQPETVEVPSTDVSVKTEQYRCPTKCGYGHQYGCELGNNESIKFDKDGALCKLQRSLKVVIHHRITVEDQLIEDSSKWFSLRFPLNASTPSTTKFGDEIMKQLALPQGSCQEITSSLGHMLVDVAVNHNIISKDGVELKLEKTIQPCSPLTRPQWKETTSINSSVNDYNLQVYGHMDPNQPIQPKIPGVCEEVIPNVESWNELFNETVPLPYVWDKPHKTFGGGSLTSGVSGGVSTHSFRVKEEPRVNVKRPE